MYTIPKELITQWTGSRRKSSIDKVSDTMCPPAEKKQLKTQLTGLFGQFDQGLKSKMKVAASAKTDAEARKSAQVVFNIAGEYHQKLHDTADKFPAALKKPLQTHVDEIDKVLQRIRQHALAGAKSRPPMTFDKELDEITAAFKKGATQIASTAKQKYRLGNVNQTSLDNYIDRTGTVMLKPAVNGAKQAKSENELYVKLGELRQRIETCRTKDLTAWWDKQKGKMPTRPLRCLTTLMRCS